MWKETRSVRWTVVGALLPLAIAIAVTLAIAQSVRLWGG
jgi:ferrous iron transport protein B